MFIYTIIILFLFAFLTRIAEADILVKNEAAQNSSEDYNIIINNIETDANSGGNKAENGEAGEVIDGQAKANASIKTIINGQIVENKVIKKNLNSNQTAVEIKSEVNTNGREAEVNTKININGQERQIQKNIQLNKKSASVEKKQAEFGIFEQNMGSSANSAIMDDKKEEKSGKNEPADNFLTILFFNMINRFKKLFSYFS